MLPPGDAQHGRPRDTIAVDAEQRLIQYALGQQGPAGAGHTCAGLPTRCTGTRLCRATVWPYCKPQLNALGAAIALVRKHIPQASVGITVTPYARHWQTRNTLEYTKKAIAPGGLGGNGPPIGLARRPPLPICMHGLQVFHGIAKTGPTPRLRPGLLHRPSNFRHGDLPMFNDFIRQQLVYAQNVRPRPCSSAGSLSPKLTWPLRA
jgi:hypothetical protein